MSLVIPETARPTNLHVRESATVRLVDSDLYDICKRVAEISPRLFIVELEDGAQHAWAIMEHCDDGVERLVFKVRELDGRVLDRLKGLMNRPLAARMDELERDEHRLRAEEEEREFEELYERFGRPMWTQLEHDGFIQRGVSYPKRRVRDGGG